MSTRRTFQVFSIISLVCKPFVVEHEGIEANDKPDMTEEESEKTERRIFLRDLRDETMMDAGYEQRRGNFDEAISLIEENMGKLEKTDYEEYPDLAGDLCEIMADACFLAAGSKVDRDKEDCGMSDSASEYMYHAIQWQIEAADLYEKSGDLMFLTLNLHAVGIYYQLIDDLEAAEQVYKRAIANAESAAPDNKDREEALFTSKIDLLFFYRTLDRIEEARQLAEELELMIEEDRNSVWTKEDVRKLLE